MFLPFASPERLLARFQRSGEPRDLGRLFDRTAPELLRVATWLAGNRADAEDLLQRTFLTVLTKRGDYDASRRAVPWLCGILGNHAKKLHEQRARPPVATAPAEERDPLTAAADAEFADAVARVRRELGSPYAEVLDLHLGEGLDAKTIAERLGRPAGTVRTQIVRGLELLRRHLPSGFVTGALLTTAAQAASLAVVRTTVLRAVGSTGRAAATTSTVGVFTLGGIVMAKKLFVVVPLLAVLLGGSAWLLLRENAPPPARPTAPAAPIVANVDTGRTPNANFDATTDAASTPRIAAAAAPAIAAEAGFATLVVRVRWNDDPAPTAGVGVVAEPLPENRLHEREGLTDARGELVFQRLRPGKWHVETPFAEGQFLDLAAATVVTVDFVGKRTGFVEGVVVDAEQEPVADARIWMSERHGPRNGFEVARTGRDGRFRLAYHTGQHLGARKAGYAPSRLRQLEGPLREVVLVLPAVGGTVRGRVVDATNEPIANAHLEVGLSGGWSIQTGQVSETHVFPTAPRLTTDARGEFVCEGAAAGDTEVRAWAEGYGPKTERVVVEGGRTAAVVLVLPRGAAVAGVVRDARGRAVADASVAVTGRYHDFGRAGTTADGEGAFRLENLSPGGVSLTVQSNQGKCVANVATTAGATTTWNPVVASDERTLAGRIVGPDGQPLAGLRIGPPTEDGFLQKPVTISDAEGAWVLRGLERTKMTLHVRCDQALLAVRKDVAVGEQPIVITLTNSETPSAWLRGRVVDTDGKPVAARLGVRRSNWTSCPLTQAGADGTFQRGSLPAGNYVITVEADGFGSRQLPVVHLAPDFDLTLPDIVLTRCGRVEFTFRGNDATGGARMFKIVRDDGVAVLWVTPEAGRASAELPPGSYFALAPANGALAYTAFTVRSEETTAAVLAFVPAAVVKFTCSDPAITSDTFGVVVRDSTGAIAESTELFLPHRRPGKALEWEVLLPAGTYSVRAWLDDGRETTAELTVGSTGAELVLTFAPR